MTLPHKDNTPYNYRVIASTTVAALAIFILDWQTELGVAVAIPYIIVIWLASFAEHRRVIWITTIVCTLLTLLGFALSPSGGELWKVLLNRGLALMAIWLTAFFINERKIAEAARIHYTSIIDFTDDAIISTTPNGILTSWNPGAERLYGYSADEMIGQSVSRIFPKDHPAELPDILDQLQRGKIVDHIETERVHKDGSIIQVSITISSIKNRQGQVIGFSSIGRDITKRKQLEMAQQKLNEELAASNEALAQSNKDLDQFASAASHDLQTPLSLIGGFAHFLQLDYQDKLDTQANDYITRIIDMTDRMQQLINDLLSYSRIDAQPQPFEAVSLDKVFDEVITDILSASIEDTSAQVTRDELPTIRGDHSQLIQLLQNLIGNGIKYQGEQLPKIHVSAERQSNGWLISVKDNGIGIAPEHHEAIFKAFHRLHFRHDYPGTGVGLAICRRVVQRHGGKIWVESQPGEGATFFFTLPDQSE